MKKIKMLMTVLCMAFMVLGMISSASALTITPTTGSPWTGSETKNLSATVVAGKVSYIGPLFVLYKQDVDDGREEGLFASSYITTFSPMPDPKGAEIKYVSGPYISVSPLYLYVKDGNHFPAWYIFELSALSWNGTETIVLEDFWTNGGAISHVTILGGTTSVPEPAMLLLLGLGLVGVAGIGRKLKK
jgi:hypothetical protein